MGKYNHKNLQISFGGTVYQCLSASDTAGSVEVSSAQCSTATGNAATHNAIGAESWAVNATILLEDDAITFETAFALGTGGELILYPTGVGVGKKSSTWTNAFVSSNAEPMSIGDFGALTVALTCDGNIARALQV